MLPITQQWQVTLALERNSSNHEKITIAFGVNPHRRVIEFFAEEQAFDGFLEENIVDLYPLNGTVKTRRFKIGDFVRTIHRNEIKEQSALATSIQGPRCIVIDFKDKTVRYENKEDIHNAEEAFSHFFRNPEPKEKIQSAIHRLFHESSIGYCIYEGSLKADLIHNTFVGQEREFLQTESGSGFFCQLCEIIMNIFKMGHKVVDANGNTYLPDTYVKSLNQDVLPFCGKNIHTFYPKVYQETYSPMSRYFALIQQIYSVEHHVDEKERTYIVIR